MILTIPERCVTYNRRQDRDEDSDARSRYENNEDCPIGRRLREYFGDRVSVGPYTVTILSKGLFGETKHYDLIGGEAKHVVPNIKARTPFKVEIVGLTLPHRKLLRAA